MCWSRFVAVNACKQLCQVKIKVDQLFGKLRRMLIRDCEEVVNIVNSQHSTVGDNAKQLMHRLVVQD